MPTRILVIRAGQLGDTAYASSIIEPLRHHYGESTVIDWVAKAGIGTIFHEDPRINNIFQIKSRRVPLPFNRGKLSVVLHSFNSPYDIVVNLELGNIFNDMVRHIRARKKIGMPYKYFEEPAETHAVDNLKLIFESFLNCKDLEYATPSLIGTDTNTIKQEFDLPTDYYILVPANSHIIKGASINHRAWPSTHWKSLMAMMSETGLNTVVIGGKNELPFFEQFKPYPPNVISLVGKTDFPQLIGLIQGAKGVITTDTGPSHIAAAVNTPVIALIGPTNFKRTGPYQTKYNQIQILSVNLDCSPCYHTERLLKCTDNKCMSGITPKSVIEHILLL
jgi:ADP-heptose:LPS heptosyltransferase